MKHNRPPKWADKFLEWYCAPRFIEEIQGDLHEAYQRRTVEKGRFAARLRFILDVFKSFSMRTIDWHALYASASMFTLKSDILTTRRKIQKRKAFFAINVAGLSTSFAAALMIFVLVRHELSFDNFHAKADRIYRVYCANADPGETVHEFPYTPPLFASAVREIPGIESIARFSKVYSTTTVKHNDKIFTENEVYVGDSSIFNIFTFDFLKGNPATALVDPRSVVLTKSAAIKYFGSEDLAFHQTLEVTLDGTETYQVTGIVQDIPGNSHYDFNILLSYDYGKESFHPQNWLAHDPVTYVLTSEASNRADVESNIKKMVDNILDPIHLSRYGESYKTRKLKGALQEYRLQPLKEVHLHSRHMGEEGSIVYIYLFSAVGMILVFIACFNYINLSTARMTWEARAAGIRKVLGASKGQVRNLFLTESIGVALVASALSVILVQCVINLDTPLSNVFTDLRSMSVENVVVPIGLALVVGVISGIVPASLIDSLDSAKALKAQLTQSARGGVLRQVFVTLQFTVSIALIICTFLMTQQLMYVQNKTLGFDKDNLLVINNVDKLGNQSATFKQVLASEQFVVQSSLCYNNIGNPYNFAAFTPVELIDQGREDLVIGIPVYVGDEDYLKTLGVEFIMGHPFPVGLDPKHQQIILNRAALRAVGWQDRKADDVIGKSIDVNGRRYELAGIVEDYHFQSLHQKIGPIAIMSHYYQGYQSLMVRIKPALYGKAIERTKELWSKIAPDVPFDYYFVNDDLERLYRSDRNVGFLFKVFASIAILIACLGLLGLSMFSAEKRTKEIGIRKVLGATVSSIVVLLTQNIVKLILLSFVIASPVTWYLMVQWLDNFAYKIDMQAGTFILSGLVTLTIALAAVGSQAIKASFTNPVRSLRYE